MIQERQYYIDIFQTGPEEMKRLTAIALANGGDYCDLYFENTVMQIHQLIDGEVSSGGLNVDYGVGIRVLCGVMTGYAYSDRTLPDDMEAAAKGA